jgi:hypothetical protein
MRIEHVGTKAQAHLRAMNRGVEKTAVLVESLSGERLCIYVAGLEGLLVGTLRDVEVNPQQGGKFWLNIETGELTPREFELVYAEETPVAMVSAPEIVEDGFVCSPELMARIEGGDVDLSIFGQPRRDDVDLSIFVQPPIDNSIPSVATVSKQFDRTVINDIYVLDVATGKMSPK